MQCNAIRKEGQVKNEQVNGRKEEREKQARNLDGKKNKENTNTKAYQGLITVLCPQAT